jgi:hypothetical protein
MNKDNDATEHKVEEDLVNLSTMNVFNLDYPKVWTIPDLSSGCITVAGWPPAEGVSGIKGGETQLTWDHLGYNWEQGWSLLPRHDRTHYLDRDPTLLEQENFF